MNVDEMVAAAADLDRDGLKKLAPVLAERFGRDQLFAASTNGNGNGNAPKGKRAGSVDSEDGLPKIETNNQHMRTTSAEAISAIVKLNDPPQVFVRGGRLVRIQMDEDDRPTIADLTVAMLRNRLARCANFVSTSEKRGVVPVAPPVSVVEDVMAMAEWPGIPPLAGVVTAPVLGPTGDIELVPGYHRSSRLFYHSPDGLELPDTTPTPERVAVARALLLDTLLGEFPFADAASRAHALAMALLAFVRPVIQGPTPLHLIDATAPGSGKSLLGEVLSLLFVPNGAAVMVIGRDEDEWRKRVTSTLLRAPSHILIDNINRPVSSGVLAGAITAQTWEDRLMGLSQNAALPVRCVWVGTGNNVSLSDELTRRTVWIRLDARMERPWERDDFRIRDLKSWAREHRQELVGAALTLIRAWIDAGRPLFAGRAPGGFERWAQILGGILQAVGVHGFLENAKELYDRLDPEREAWLAFLSAWHQRHANNAVGVAEVFPLAKGDDLLTEYIQASTEQGQKVRLGALIRSKCGRPCGDYVLLRDGERKNAVRYRVSLVSLVSLFNPNAREYQETCESTDPHVTDTPLESGRRDSLDSPDSPPRRLNGTQTQQSVVRRAV